MSDAPFQLSGLTFGYQTDQPVLERLDLTLAAGDRAVVSGANGSGKTSLLRLMVGLAKPWSGEITAFGKTRRDEADFREVRARAGFLFQDPDDQLFCPTVGEDAAFGPLNLGQSRDQAREVVRQTLKLLDLEGFEPRVTYRLSGGEKRLVSLACVLAMGPDVLLLDEPTTGLDPAHTDRLVQILTSLDQAMLIVTHDQAFAERVATRRLHLQSGRFG